MLPEKLLDEKLDRVDYYALLGVARDATPERIREGFHQFAVRFHPDQHIGDELGQSRAARIFKRGSEGYRVLLDPTLRTRYDAALARGEVRLSAEAERRQVVSEADGASQPLPTDVAAFFDKATEFFAKGDLKNAKTFLMLAAKRSSHPKIQKLTREILEAERAMLRKR